MSGTYQLLPALSEQQYADLQADIKANGVRVPIDVDEHNEILDGHHRAAIAAALGYDCPRRTVSGLDEADKRSHALAVNMQRRMLSRDQKRALIEASVKVDPQLSDREHARRTASDHKTVAAARSGLEAGGEIPHLEKRQNPQGRSQPASKPRPASEPERFECHSCKTEFGLDRSNETDVGLMCNECFDRYQEAHITEGEDDAEERTRQAEEQAERGLKDRIPDSAERQARAKLRAHWSRAISGAAGIPVFDVDKVMDVLTPAELAAARLTFTNLRKWSERLEATHRRRNMRLVNEDRS